MEEKPAQGGSCDFSHVYCPCRSPELAPALQDGRDRPWPLHYDGRTELHVAASEGHLKVVDMLQESSQVSVNAEDR